MKPSLQYQIEYYTNQVDIYLSYDYTDETTLKFMIEKLNKLVNELQSYKYKFHNFTYMVTIDNELNNEINEKIKRYNHFLLYGMITRSEAQFFYLDFLMINFKRELAFNIYTNTISVFI